MDAQLSVLARGFLLAPFDVKAAAIAAKISRDRELLQSLKTQENRTRICIKADINIVASAIAAGATSLVTEDSGIHKIVERFGSIVAVRLPEVAG
jgi:DNA-binding NarL/FixJ family response regulator